MKLEIKSSIFHIELIYNVDYKTYVYFVQDILTSHKTGESIPLPGHNLVLGSPVSTVDEALDQAIDILKPFAKELD